MIKEKEATMGFAKKLLACCIALALLPTFATAAYAAGTGTQADPHIGGNDYGQADDASIILHKYDMTKFEETKAKELITAGSLGEGGKVTYKPGENPTGALLQPTDVIGTYTTTDSSTPVNVTLQEMTSLGKIVFMIEKVELSSGKTPGSANPADYQSTNEIDHYAKTDDNGLIAWEGLPNGHYRITEPQNDTGNPVGDNSYIISVPMVDPADNTKTISTVHLYPKNTTSPGPVIIKEKPSLDDHNGNIVPWTIKAELPGTMKATKGSQEYVITDTMSDGLFFKGNVEVYYLKSGAKQTLTEGALADYTLAATAGGSSMVITLNDAGFTKVGTDVQAGSVDVDANGKYILYVTYDTIVNLSEEDFNNSVTPKNEVDLKFVNSDGTEYTDKPPIIIIDNYAGIKVLKQDGSDKLVMLPNAKFKIYTGLSSGAVDPTKVLKDAAGAEIVFTTDANGEFFCGGLGKGDYYIVETEAPANYKKINGYTHINISETDVGKNAIQTVTIYNYRDNTFSLPETGGMGTMIFVVLGILLVVGAGAVYVSSKKRAERNKE